MKRKLSNLYVSAVFAGCMMVVLPQLSAAQSNETTSQAPLSEHVQADHLSSKASTCMSCHGPGGISQYGQWPNLAGQKAPYIVNQLHAFQNGTRKNSMMENVIKDLTESDIKQLAQYFSQLPAKTE